MKISVQAVDVLCGVTGKALEAFLAPVELSVLRELLMKTPAGRQVQKESLRGFRPTTVTRPRLLEAFNIYLRQPDGASLAEELLRAWAAGRVVAAISHEVHGQRGPFAPAPAPEFIDRLGMVMSADGLSVLQRFAAAGHTDRAPAKRLRIRAEPFTAATVEPIEPPSAAWAMPTVPPIFQSIVDRDEWAWDNDCPQYVPDDERLFELQEHKHSEARKAEEHAKYADLVARRVGLIKPFEASTYWLSAIADASAAGTHEAARSFAQSFIGARLARVGVEGGGSPGDALDAALADPGAAVQLSAVHALIALARVDASLALDQLSQKGRTQLAIAVERLFPRLRRAIAESRGSEPALLTAVREFSRLDLEVIDSARPLLAGPTLEQVRKSREKLISGLKALSVFVPQEERGALARVVDLLGPMITAYERAGESDQERAFKVFRESVAEVEEELISVAGSYSACVLSPLAYAVDAAVTGHHKGSVLASSASLAIRVIKPARVVGDSWTFVTEVRNDGTGAALETMLSVELEGQQGIRIEPTQQQVGRLAPGGNSTATWTVNGVADPPPEKLAVGIALSYSDRGTARSVALTLGVRSGRQVDLASRQFDAPYSIRSITDPARLKGRSDQLTKLREGFHRGSSFTVTGQRRVGKTSLVKVFMSELAHLPDALALHLPLGEVSASAGTADLGRLGRDLADRVLEAYEERFGGEAGLTAPAVAEFRDAFNPTFATFLRRFSARHKSLRLAFAFDDFDELPNPLFTGDIGRQFFLALRALMDRGTSFFFVGSERLPALIAEQAERLNQVETVRLDYLDANSLEELVREPTEGLVDFDDEAVQRIGDWSARNPYFATIMCTRLWDRAVRDSDPAVSRLDVDEAASSLVDDSPRSFYQHFWSDSPRLLDEERASERSKAFLLLHALTKLQDNPFHFVSRKAVEGGIKDLTPPEAGVEMQVLLQRRVVEVSRSDPSLVRIRVPAFAAWLAQNGTVEVQSVAPSSIYAQSAPTELTAEEVMAVAKGLEYRGARITTDQVRLWLKQFGSLDDQRLMLRLLAPIRDRGLHRLETYTGLLAALDERVRREASARGFARHVGEKRRIENYFVTHADESGKSGSTVATQYRRENRYMDRQAGGPAKVVPLAISSKERAVLICVDDFVGTGASASADICTNVIGRLEVAEVGWKDKVLVVYAAVTGFETGLEAIRNAVGEDVVVVCTLPLADSDRAFHPDSGLFTFDERERARELAHRFGSQLEKRHPLGYEDSQALVVLYDTVPNNTLPILYKGGRVGEATWIPLFPRS